MRRLQGRCPHSDMFGKAPPGVVALVGAGGRGVRDGRVHDAPDRVPRLRDRRDRPLIADQTLRSGDARHLLTVPGVNAVCTATFPAAIGDIRRFQTSRKLVAYLGLDPKVRQSGSEPARLGRISKQGSSQARWALVEATHSAILQSDPLRAFHQTIGARRSVQIATVAAARNLAGLFWWLLTREENDAHARTVADRQEAAQARADRRRQAP